MGRHYGFCTIVCSQSAKSLFLNRTVRANTYYTLIGRLPVPLLEGLWEEFVCKYEKLNDFLAYYKANVKDTYNFILYSLKPEKGKDSMQLVCCDMDYVNSAKVK
jgi:hypothetical protein